MHECAISLTLILMASCEFPRPTDIGDETGTSEGNFTLALDVAHVRIAENSDATVTVTVSRDRLADPVIVTVTGLSPGVTVDPLTIDVDTGTLTLHAAPARPRVKPR